MMLCSQCKAPVRPVVAIDIDGTLGKYHDHFLTFAENYLGFSLKASTLLSGMNTREYPYNTEFNEWLGIDKRTYRDIKLAYRQGGMKRSMPPYGGASKITNSLYQAGIEVWIATTRPWLRLDNIDPDTRHWLERHTVHYEGLIYGDNKWERLIEIVGHDRIIGIVDDLPEEIDAADTLGLPTIQKENGHTDDAKRYPYYKSLEIIRVHLLTRATKWRLEHDHE